MKHDEYQILFEETAENFDVEISSLLTTKLSLRAEELEQELDFDLVAIYEELEDCIPERFLNDDMVEYLDEIAQIVVDNQEELDDSRG